MMRVINFFFDLLEYLNILAEKAEAGWLHLRAWQSRHYVGLGFLTLGLLCGGLLLAITQEDNWFSLAVFAICAVVTVGSIDYWLWRVGLGSFDLPFRVMPAPFGEYRLVRAKGRDEHGKPFWTENGPGAR